MNNYTTSQALSLAQQFLNFLYIYNAHTRGDKKTKREIKVCRKCGGAVVKEETWKQM